MWKDVVAISVEDSFFSVTRTRTSAYGTKQKA